MRILSEESLQFWYPGVNYGKLDDHGMYHAASKPSTLLKPMRRFPLKGMVSMCISPTVDLQIPSAHKAGALPTVALENSE